MNMSKHQKPKAKLSPKQVDEYFRYHLPYRNRILSIHKKLCEQGPWEGDQAVLEACFEASLVTGRMYLNMLGIRRSDRNDKLVAMKFRPDDVSVKDLCGKLVDVTSLPALDYDLFVGFLRMADKGAAHLTMPMNHPWQRTHEAIERIVYYLQTNLYDVLNREM
ncbi:hypothetical protein ES703_104033 [subsurface metagenome]